MHFPVWSKTFHKPYSKTLCSIFGCPYIFNGKKICLGITQAKGFLLCIRVLGRTKLCFCIFFYLGNFTTIAMRIGVNWWAFGTLSECKHNWLTRMSMQVKRISHVNMASRGQSLWYDGQLQKNDLTIK